MATLSDSSALEASGLVGRMLDNLGVITGDTLDVATLEPVPRRTWDNQQAFLAFMCQYGTIQKAARESGVQAESVRRWRNGDVLGFADRFMAARAAYGDYLEDMVHERLENPTGNRGSDVLLMARLNAEKPDKWRPNVKIQLEVPNEVIQHLRALQELGNRDPKELPAPKIVDGKAEVLPWE